MREYTNGLICGLNVIIQTFQMEIPNEKISLETHTRSANFLCVASCAIFLLYFSVHSCFIYIYMVLIHFHVNKLVESRLN